MMGVLEWFAWQASRSVKDSVKLCFLSDKSRYNCLPRTSEHPQGSTPRLAAIYRLPITFVRTGCWGLRVRKRGKSQRYRLVLWNGDQTCQLALGMGLYTRIRRKTDQSKIRVPSYPCIQTISPERPGRACPKRRLHPRRSLRCRRWRRAASPLPASDRANPACAEGSVSSVCASAGPTARD
jgi:hypothetical protein